MKKSNHKKIPIEIKAGSSGSTIDDFNSKVSCIQILELNGWSYSHTNGESEYYTRPGKDKGTSLSYKEDDNIIYVFTSSTILEQGKAYSAFGLYAAYYHNEDYKEASRALFKKGYGKRELSQAAKNKNTSYQITTGNDQEKELAQNIDILAEMLKRRFDINRRPKNIEYCFYFHQAGAAYKLSSFGDLILIKGAAKSRKTAVLYEIISSILNPEELYLGFHTDIKGKNIIVLDTEQSELDFYNLNTKAISAAGHDQTPSNLYSYDIADYSINDRLAFIEYVVKKVGNVGAVLIDGIVDICEDYNDQKISRALVDHLSRLSKVHNFLCFPVLHNARSTGEARGHLGTELLNKCKVVIDVTKDKDTGKSTVSFPYTRNAAPENFEIIHDEKGELKIVG